MAEQPLTICESTIQAFALLANRYSSKSDISNSVLATSWYVNATGILKYCNLQQELYTSNCSFHNQILWTTVRDKLFNTNTVSIHRSSKFFRRQYSAVTNNQLLTCNAVNIECSFPFSQAHSMLQSDISFHEKAPKENRWVECWLTCMPKDSKQNSWNAHAIALQSMTQWFLSQKTHNVFRNIHEGSIAQGAILCDLQVKNFQHDIYDGGFDCEILNEYKKNIHSFTDQWKSRVDIIWAICVLYLLCVFSYKSHMHSIVSAWKNVEAKAFLIWSEKIYIILLAFENQQERVALCDVNDQSQYHDC